MATRSKPLLIIFYRNPQPGAVKTRVAATMGDDKALQVFNKLAAHTRDITEALPMNKIVYYSEFIQQADIWRDHQYMKDVQRGDDLGARMRNAFESGFRDHYDTICIIGTDCFELTTDIIAEAFDCLRRSDTVIGPAFDGGYYLLGMRTMHRELFKGKKWSTENVCRDTIADFNDLRLTYVKLPTLRDVDTEDDIPAAWRMHTS